MVHDLLVIGNGLAAQTFLFELFTKKSKMSKSQNFSVVQVYADQVCPPCSERSTATVALSGIEEGISPLGNELRESYFLFEEFFKQHHPFGIEEVEQFILYAGAEEEEKLRRRYQTLHAVKSPLLKQEMKGILMPSYQISPPVYKDWMESKLNAWPLLRRLDFVRAFEKNEQGIYQVSLLSGEVLKARKLLLATGAYSRIFSHFFSSHSDLSMLASTQILAGSYLERTVDLGVGSFFITLNGHKCLYRSLEKRLVLGSASQKGAFESADFEELKSILALFQDHLFVSLGQLEDFHVITGLRHKGKQRRPIYRAIDDDQTLFVISGLYKNGFTFAHLAAKSVLEKIDLLS